MHCTCSTLRQLQDSQHILALSHFQFSNQCALHTIKGLHSGRCHGICHLHDPALCHALSAQLCRLFQYLTFHNWRSLPSHNRCSTCSRAATPRRIKKVPSPCLRAINLSYRQVTITSVPSLLSLLRLLPSSLPRYTPSPVHCVPHEISVQQQHP